MNPHQLQQLLSNRSNGIYSVCSAHPWVLRAACDQALNDNSLLLIEATSNQVNQEGGYTGMHPADFRRFVEQIADASGFPLARLILGGDHLGPNPWRHLPAEKAMEHGEELVREYAAAGFTKIHLDTSMSCADDPAALSNSEVASRAVRLASAAEAAHVGGEKIVYVIGTEVPTPGGATHDLDQLQVTSVDAAEETWTVHRHAFERSNVSFVLDRILAMVVQPGVEFGHTSVVEYDRDKAADLSLWIRSGRGPLTFEAHSTDYQRMEAYPALVQDGFGILKVGPALTFAMREALFALEAIERWLVEDTQLSKLTETLDAVMLQEPKDWASHYHGKAGEQKLLRTFSFSDRIRYYWGEPAVQASVIQLIRNLESRIIPETLLSQYLPVQYTRVREGLLQNAPLPLVLESVRDVLQGYASACRPSNTPTDSRILPRKPREFI